MKTKLPTRDEVEFAIRLDSEDIPIEGYFQTDDPEQDRADEQAIVEAVNAGSIEAWCYVVVTARWREPVTGREFEGSDSLGGCSFAPWRHPLELDTEIENTVEAHGMRDEAFADLLKVIEKAHVEARALAVALDGAS